MGARWSSLRGGGTMVWRHDDGSLVGWRRHEAEEREEGATECSGAHSRGRTRGKTKGGRSSDRVPFIGDVVGSGVR
jgi:hypothetical protein